MQHVIVMFGEAEKGQLKKPYFCRYLEQLVDYFGSPPQGTHGLELAIQSILFKYELLFFRVQQEGFSTDDYMFGINYLEHKFKGKSIDALGIPGVGDSEIIDATENILNRFKSILIITEKDLYDYATSRN